MAEDRAPSPLRGVVVTVAAIRYLVPILAIPLVPVLVPDRVPLLVLLRPGKEILLLAGGLWRASAQHSLLAIFLAYLPLMLGGVWVFFLLGRLYAEELRAGEGPAWLHRLIPHHRLEVGHRVLERRGPAIAVIGRLAAMPATIIAAAAGTSTVDARRFLLADFAGAMAAFAIATGVGAALGSAYEQGGAWMTGAGVVLVVVLYLTASRWARREAERIAETGGE